ncbi:conserved hypothetical protein [Pediculus humanus corporis]|uniref:Bromo domain-containing protein n=1 Tax=Pediculus humanus subsp. corporis TaxID=121224 RepID=E0VVB5_PEDHC|nr:uncharacterized protein Phum_PHUM461010 [Pediculus humanus corporis]EEB17321.1 conserved hypothetical protein [Pediculus humanus corporis]
MKLPSKNKLPDYYDIIKKPLDIKKIINRIEDGKDFTQMCQNAQIYNEEASLIHENLIVLQSVFTNARQRLEQDAETDEDKDDEDGNSDSESVRMKIKIKSGKGGRGGEGRGSTRRRKTQPKYTNSDDEDEDD